MEGEFCNGWLGKLSLTTGCFRPEGLKERAAETKGVFQAKAKTWDHVSLAYVFTGRRSTSLEQDEQGGRGSMNRKVE